jgi:glycosyltransferase involved in cell wall biosynthesis
LISVGLPVVKIEFLESAIKSVLNQSFKDFELIILNNGSPHNVKEIVDKFTDDRIKYYENNEMIPIIENWNKVLNYASGEYFVLFSDDDIYEKDFLSELNSLTEQYPNVNLFHTRVRIINEKNETSYLAPSAPSYETAADFIWHRIKNYRLQYAQDFMVKTSALREIGGFVDLPNAWGSDDATWYRIANKGGVAASNRILCNWRESNFNLARKANVEEKLAAVKAFKNWLDDFIKNELTLTNDTDKEILSEIKKVIAQNTSTKNGFALQLGVRGSLLSSIIIFKRWLSFKRKFELDLISLGWANALLLKKIKNSK